MPNISIPDCFLFVNRFTYFFVHFPGGYDRLKKEVIPLEIYVYGTGCGAGELIDTALDISRVTAFVDPAAGGSFLGRPVISPHELAEHPCDLIIVASRHAEEISRELDALGIDPDKLLFLKNHLLPVDRNQNYDAARAILGDAFVEKLRHSERLIRVPLWTECEKIEGPEAENDYVRLKTLEAICERLKEIPGDIAELGVYQGGFARWLNRLLPDRTLWLFDTFEGFDLKETANYSVGEGFLAAHRNTAISRVLSVLPNPEMVHIRQGLFPETAQDLKEKRYSLVSLDVDLEESTYAGLCFFLPRLSRGGFLLLHDYNNPRLPGVKKAFARYEEEYGRQNAVPLCDVNGTLVIVHS